MNKEILYKKIYGLWPEEIDFSNDVAQHNSDRSVVFWALINHYEDVKSKFDIQVDHWDSIGIWSFHQAIVEKARQFLIEGRKSVRKASVTLKDFDQMLRDNLEDPSWSEEKTIYLSSNG